MQKPERGRAGASGRRRGCSIMRRREQGALPGGSRKAGIGGKSAGSKSDGGKSTWSGDAGGFRPARGWLTG